MSHREKPALTVSYAIAEPNGRYADLGKAQVVSSQKKQVDEGYPADRGMPSRDALRAFGVRDASDIEIIESM